MNMQNEKMIHIYTTTGCPTCLMIKKELIKEGVEFIELNVMEDEGAMELASAHNILSVPTVIYIKNGTEVKQLTTPTPNEVITEYKEIFKND